MSETYHYGQGIIYMAERLTGTTLGPRVDIGDVSELTGSLTEESFDHKESRTGGKGTVRKLYPGKTMTWNMTMHQLDTENVARFTQGTSTKVPSGSVTSEVLGTIIVGQEFKLAHFGVSNVVITDSTGSPVTIAPSHYEYNQFGFGKFITLPSSPAPVMPLKAAYTYKAYNQAAFFNAAKKDYAFFYEGINLAENNKPVLLELYKVSAGLLQTLSMITNGNQLAAAPVTLEALLDSTKPAAGPLGQYGRLVTIDY